MRQIVPRRKLTLICLGAVIFAAVSVAACGGADSSTPLGGGNLTGATQAPIPTSPPQQTVVPRATVVPSSGTTPTPSSGGPGSESGLEGQIAQAQEQRIIVRTVNLDMIVANVSTGMQEIARLAAASGGWVVSSEQSETFRGTISIRVPAGSLDSAVDTVRGMATKVESESSSSQDFTEEYTDVTARIGTLQRTVDALNLLYERAETIEEAFQVGAEITKVQSDLDALQGRLSFLANSAAYSLISMSLRAEPMALSVDAGPDIPAAVDERVQFRVRFTPPEGVGDFTVRWEFGDAREGTTNRVAPTGNGAELISAPVPHTYQDDLDSPYIVRVHVSASGTSGIAEGTDTKIVTVSRIPVFEIFAGDNIVTEAGDEVRFRGSLTRPDGVDNLKFRWEFGDGSAPVEGDLPPGMNVAEATHRYQHHRPTAYRAVLTVTGETPAGQAMGTAMVDVLVNEALGLSGTSVNPGETSRNAVRALTAFGGGLLNVIIWLAVLSPIWLAVGAVALFINRRYQRSVPRPRPIRTSQPGPGEPGDGQT